MKYLNWLVAKSREPIMLNASHEEVGIWFKLLSYCHDVENGGIINACSDWTDNVWAAVAQTTSARLRAPSTLWKWSGLSLVIHLYDVEAELLAKKQVKMGQIYAQKRWEDERQRKLQRRDKKVTKFTPPKEENG